MRAAVSPCAQTHRSVVEGDGADEDGKDVCMCIHETASGADVLLNLQLGTGGGEKKRMKTGWEREEKEREREDRGVGGVNSTHHWVH